MVLCMQHGLALNSVYVSASLGVLASWIAYLQQCGLREENIFRVNEATEAAAALKSKFEKGVSYVHTLPALVYP